MKHEHDISTLTGDCECLHHYTCEMCRAYDIDLLKALLDRCGPE